MEDLDGSLTALNGIALELLELATAVVKSGDETSVMWVTAKDFAAIAAGVP